MLEEKRLAVLSIIVEDRSVTEKLNAYLSEYGEYVIGRMGIPYKEKSISIISITMDAPNDKISALSGKLGALNGVSSKTIYSNK